MWIRLDGLIAGSQFSENNPGSDGPVVTMEMLGGELASLIGSGPDGASGWGGDVEGSVVPRISPPEGFDFEQWYYVAVVLDPDNGNNYIYLSDGTEVWSHSQARNTGFIGAWSAESAVVDRVRINGNYVTGGGDYTIDNFRIFDLAFDPNSELVEVFGIPEPSSVLLLCLGSLLLTKRR